MNKITELNRALPMVASVLGKKYGVQVEIGGNTACTDGKVIRLPTLPLESDSVLINLVRSYLDHESAHIRETNFDVLQDKDLTPLIKNIWNIFEDWRVENQLAKRFPGCRTNLHWLIDHEFTKKMKASSFLLINCLDFTSAHDQFGDQPLSPFSNPPLGTRLRALLSAATTLTAAKNSNKNN